MIKYDYIFIIFTDKDLRTRKYLLFLWSNLDKAVGQKK